MSVFRVPTVAFTSGEQLPFDQAALAHADALYRTARRVTGNLAEAEDLVQDTYFKAFTNEARFEAGTNLRAWLFTILMNTWRNRRRDAGRDPVAVGGDDVDLIEDRAAPGSSPEELLVRATLGTDLRAALSQLPDAFREAVWLRDVDEFTYAETASMLDVPVGTVMSRISRGRRQLYDTLTAGRDRERPAGMAGGR